MTTLTNESCLLIFTKKTDHNKRLPFTVITLSGFLRTVEAALRYHFEPEKSDFYLVICSKWYARNVITLSSS